MTRTIERTDLRPPLGPGVCSHSGRGHRLWVDDLRTPPGPEWDWEKTSRGAIAYLGRREPSEVVVVSLDHDLGGDDTTRPVVLWMVDREFWPSQGVRCHSANPVGHEWIIGMVRRYGPY